MFVKRVCRQLFTANVILTLNLTHFVNWVSWCVTHPATQLLGIITHFWKWYFLTRLKTAGISYAEYQKLEISKTIFLISGLVIDKLTWTGLSQAKLSFYITLNLKLLIFNILFRFFTSVLAHLAAHCSYCGLLSLLRPNHKVNYALTKNYFLLLWSYLLNFVTQLNKSISN